MPYILRQVRDEFVIDTGAMGVDLVQALTDRISFVVECGQSRGGILNYLFTSIALRSLPDNPHYTDYNDIIGALECCKQELYRRHIGPYEDTAIERNGDVT